MAGGTFVADGGGRNYEGRVTAFVSITCIVAAMGGLLFGYDLGISGGVTSMEEFLAKFFPEVERQMHKSMHETAYCKFDNQLLQLFTSSLYLAALVSSFLASVITRSKGRKVSMLLGGLAFLVGALLNGFAKNVAMLIFGRLFLGVGVGFANQILVGSFIGWKFGFQGVGTLTPATANAILTFICFYVAGFAWSWGPLGWLIPSEICPLEIRPAGQATNVSVNMIFTFLIGQFFLTLLCHMKFFLFYFFAVMVVIMTIFIYLLLPETKGVPIEEMGIVWKQHWFWTRYVPDDAVIGAGHGDDSAPQA